eukprot:2877946-Rhodomonas_salina.3
MQIWGARGHGPDALPQVVAGVFSTDQPRVFQHGLHVRRDALPCQAHGPTLLWLLRQPASSQPVVHTHTVVDSAADDVQICQDALDPDLAGDMFAATLSSSPINISSPPAFSRSDIPSFPGGGCASEDVPTSPGGGSPMSDSSPGGGSQTSGTASAGELQCFPNASKHKGKRLLFGDKVPPISEKLRYWKDCESKTLKNVTDVELAEYLIG